MSKCFSSLKIQNIHILFFFSNSKAPLFIFFYLFAYYINKTYSFELKHNNMKTKKWLHMKKEHNTLEDSSLNYNFTIRAVICDFFPYPITEIPSGMKGTEKIHLVHHHYCLFFFFPPVFRCLFVTSPFLKDLTYSAS